MRTRSFLLAILLLPGLCPAAPTWTKARSGSFEAISEDGKRSATQALAQFEQFTFALGSVLGKPDLRMDPPVRILLFKNAAELNTEGCTGLQQGRDRLNVCTVGEAQLSPETLRGLTKILLDNNFSAMPPAIEQALITFFGTLESKGTHVTWGTPPPPSERTRDWAMLHRIITQPDYAGKARVYLHNLAAGMDRAAATRNALGEDAKKFDADTDNYYAAGNFPTATAPYRPINPDHDFSVTTLTSDEGLLIRADLLNTKSAELYKQLLGLGKHQPEANEGLGLLATRANDLPHAREYFQAALDAGSKNAVMITTYAGLLEDTAKAVKLLQQAISIDPKYAPARWMMGEKSNDPRMKLFQWKQATALAPRNMDWWVRYAQLCVEQKQFQEAGRAWLSASQAAPDAAHREEYLANRGRIDEQRLHSEDEIRQREQAEQAREIEALKAQARKEIADLEARANKNAPSSKDPVFDWTEIHGETKEGTLDSVDCAGKQYRLHISTAGHQTFIFLIRDLSKIEFTGERVKISCTIQKPRAVSVTYKPLPTGPIAGEVTGLEFPAR